MAPPVQTSLSYISETRAPGKKSQGVFFVRFEHGYHLVPFNCVHRSYCQFFKPIILYNFFNWPSPLVGCGEVCGRSTTHFSQMVDPSTDLSSNIPRTKNLGTVVAPLGGTTGRADAKRGWVVGISGVPRASCEPRASLIVRAPFALRAPGASSKVSKWAILQQNRHFRTWFFKEYGIRPGFQ